MKKIHTIVWLLLFSLLLCACGDGNAEDPTLTEEQGTAREIVLASNGKAAFSIVVSELCSEKVSSAAEALKKRLKEVTGVSFRIKDDYTRGDEAVESSGEIIVGNCRRADAQTILKSLKYRDYGLFANESNIMLVGYEDSKISAAVYAMIDLLSNERITSANGVTTLHWEGDSIKSSSVYQLETITFGGVDISEYQIVYPADESDLYREYAFEVQRVIGRNCGTVLPVVSDNEAAGANEILIGNTKREECKAFYSGAAAPDELEYGVEIRNGKILIFGAGYYSVGYAVDFFESKVDSLKTPSLDQLSNVKKSMIPDLPARTGACRIMSYNILADLKGWGPEHIPVSSNIRKEFVAGLIKAYQPDVIALQEVTSTWGALLPELVNDQYGFIHLELSGKQKNACPLVYNQSKLTVIDSGYNALWEGDTAHIYQTVTWAVFENKETRERFAAIGTHWKTDATPEKQLAEADLTANLVKRIQTEYQVPVFAMGDFNATPNSQAYALFTESCGLKNGTGTMGVDHIFYSQGVKLTGKGSETGGAFQFGSDHFPMWIDANLQ